MEGMGGAAIAGMLKENCYITGGFYLALEHAHIFSSFSPYSLTFFLEKSAAPTPSHMPLSPQFYATAHHSRSGLPV